MLPCNVIVYEDKGRVFVSVIRPTVAMHSEKGRGKLLKVINSLSMENSKHPTRKVFDIVCRMELDIEDVRHSLEHNGTEYYFCSETCKGHFVDDPKNMQEKINNSIK